MARTIQDLLTEARVYIQDSDPETERYSNADLIVYLNNAIQEIRRMRPDAYINTYESDITEYTTADLATDFPLDGQFYTATAYFIAGSAALRDDEHVVDSRALGLLGLFSSKLLRVGT